MKSGLVALLGVSVLLVGGCASNGQRTDDRVAAGEQDARISEGTFARAGDADEWRFRSNDPQLGETSLSVSDETQFMRDGQRVDRHEVREGLPVRVTWDEERNELLRVEVLENGQAPGYGEGGMYDGDGARQHDGNGKHDRNGMQHDGNGKHDRNGVQHDGNGEHDRNGAHHDGNGEHDRNGVQHDGNGEHDRNGARHGDGQQDRNGAQQRDGNGQQEPNGNGARDQNGLEGDGQGDGTRIQSPGAGGWTDDGEDGFQRF